MSWVPASTKAAFVVVLAFGPVSAVPCSAIYVLLHVEIIDQSITSVKPRVHYREKNTRGRGRHGLAGQTRAQGSVASFRLRRFVVWSLPLTHAAKEASDDGD